MSIYGGLRKAAGKAGTATAGGACNGHSADTCNNGSSAGGVPITALDATKSIAGNICRCTGYRPILDACKSFSGDVDVEDLGLNSFWASKHKADAALLPPYNSEEDPKFPSFLIDELESRQEGSPPKGLSFEHEEGRKTTVKRQWITAAILEDAFELLKLHSTGNSEVQLVAGNTGAGVYKDRHPQVYVDIGRIPELQVVKATGEGLEVGAGIPLSKLIGLFETESNSESVVYKELAKHVKQIASEQVRNRASLGGNLVLAQKFGFDSDLATILVGAGAEVTVASTEGQTNVPVEEFLSQGGLEPGRILISVHIPSWKDLSKAEGTVGDKLFFKTYRISCRPSGNAVAYINAAFLAVVDQRTQVIRDLKLAFGAFGGPHAIRAGKTEKLLVGKSVSPALLLEAINTLKEEINPPPTIHKSAYRRSVAVAFFFDFFSSSLPSTKSDFASTAALAEEEEDDDEVDVQITTEKGDVSASNGEASGNGSAASNGKALSNGSAASNGEASSNVSAASNGKALSNGSAHNDGLQVVEFGTKTKHKVVKGKSQTSTTGSSQKFVTSTEFWPVAQPSQKTGAHLQASGRLTASCVLNIGLLLKPGCQTCCMCRNLGQILIH